MWDVLRSFCCLVVVRNLKERPGDAFWATEGFLSYLGRFHMHWHHHASDFLECRSPFSQPKTLTGRVQCKPLPASLKKKLPPCLGLRPRSSSVIPRSPASVWDFGRDQVLIASRGEIACRIIHNARRMGISGLKKSVQE